LPFLASTCEAFMNDDSLKLNRRRFLRTSAIAAAAGGAAGGITARTDVLAQAEPPPLRALEEGDEFNYNYSEPP